MGDVKYPFIYMDGFNVVSPLVAIMKFHGSNELMKASMFLLELLT